jgi:hypothetical protein
MDLSPARRSLREAGGVSPCGDQQHVRVEAAVRPLRGPQLAELGLRAGRPAYEGERGSAGLCEHPQSAGEQVGGAVEPLVELVRRRRDRTKEASEYAARALEADQHGEVAAAGLRSIEYMDEEDAEYIAQRLRQQYAPALASEELRQVVEHAAAVCDASDELRVLRPADRSTYPPVSVMRVSNPDAYMTLAEQTAENDEGGGAAARH